MTQDQVNGEQCDVFSLGTVLFVMLFGFPLYECPLDSDKRFSMAYYGKLAELVAPWNGKLNISDEAIHLVQNIVCPVEKRFSIADILAHPWMNRVFS